MQQDKLHPGHNVYKEWLDHSEKIDSLKAKSNIEQLSPAEEDELEARGVERANIESVAVRSAFFEEEN